MYSDGKEVIVIDDDEAVSVYDKKEVTQKDDEGNVHWSVTKTEGLLDLAMLEAQIQKPLEARGGVAVKVDCGGRFRGIRVGEIFECHAQDKDGETLTIKVTVTDAEGNVDWKVVESP